MLAVSLAIAIAAISAPDTAGFTCTAANGQLKRLNIDLLRRRYNDGVGAKKIVEISDLEIVLDGGNPDLMNTPIGSIISTLKLNRTNLILVEQLAMPSQGVNKVVNYQCIRGEVIDFTVGRRF